MLGPKRLDHEPTYSCAIAGIVLSTFLAIVKPRAINAPISNLSVQIQASLIISLFLGACVCLYGIFMGGPFDVWRQANRLVRCLLGKPQQLPLDPRRPYNAGVCGIPTIIIGLIFYAVNIFINYYDSIVNITGAVLVSFLNLGFFFQELRFLMEIRRIGKTAPVLIEHEIRRRTIEQSTEGLSDE